MVRSVGEELAGFRRRAIAAETRLKELEAAGEGGGESNARAPAKLKAEAHDMRERLDRATDRAEQMLERVRFLRQQQLRGE
jgi:hypothetical protein